jgi:lysophospholipase L1-like esterase
MYSDSFSGPFVDLEEEIPIEGVDKDGNSFWDDALHFSPQGYDRMADLIFDVLSDKFKRLSAAEEVPVRKT